MKKVLLSSLLLLFVTYGIASAGMFGPTEPAAQPGKFSLGVGYFWEDTKWKTDGDDVRTQSNMGYLEGSFAPIKEFEVFGRLGGADLRTKGEDPNFADSAKMFGTLGVKAIFYQDKMFGFGAFAQGTYHFQDYKDSYADTVTVGGVSVPADIEVKFKDFYNVQAGLSAQVKVQNFIIYGGGFWYYARTKAEVTVTAAGAVGSDSTTFKENTPIGGFLGVKVPFTKAISLNLEGQYRDELAGGAILRYAF
jgi:hypothetical protein